MHFFHRHATSAFALIALTEAYAARAETPSFHHHQQGADGEEQDHYKDEGEKPAKARVGRTQFQARALLGKDGVTDLEVTTGSLDSSTTPPGYLSEVHVKAFRLDGTRQFDKEFEHLRSGGGYAKFSFPLPVVARRTGDDDEAKKDTRLEHGQLLKLKLEGKGLLSGDEGEAEAKLETTVLYRPDLAVTSLHYPGVARLKTAVDVTASVVELRRDVGAHADCILSVDGAPVDKAAGIWVDRNGAVSCHFAHIFTAAGKHTVSVAVENVTPGDYDVDNNSLSGTIQIESLSLLAYFSSVTDLTNSSSFLRDLFATPTSTVPDQHIASSTTLHTQTRMLTGTIPAAVNLPLKQVSYADQSDGIALSSVSFTNVAADSSTALTDPTYDNVAIIARYDGRTGGWFKMSRYSNATTGAGVTNVSWNFFGGDVTYHSEYYCQSVVGVFTCRSGSWTPNPSPPPFGAQTLALGKSYGADVVIDDGTPYQGHPAMALATTSSSSLPPPPAFAPYDACRSLSLSGLFPKVCIRSAAATGMTTGSAAFTPPQ